MGGPLVDVADAVAPLIRGDEIAAGKAQHAKAQLLERGDHLGTETLDCCRAGMSETVPT